eukprot:210487_1
MGLTRVIFSWSYILILWLIITPFIVYCCIKLYQYRYHPAVSNRLWKASLSTEIAVLCIVMINRPLTAFVNLLNYTDDIIPFAFSTLTWAIFFYFIVYFFAFRIWFLHYKTNFSLSIEKKQWQTIINKNKWGNSWYIKHMDSYGNEKWVAIRVTILYIIVVIAHVTIYIITLSNTISQGFLLLVGSPVLLFDIILMCKTSKQNDIFFIRYELNLVIIITFMVAIAIIITTILSFDKKWYTDLISDSIGVWYSLFFTIIQTLLVLKKCKLLGEKPIKISLTTHTQQKYSINFKSENNNNMSNEYSVNSVMKRYFQTMNEEAQFALFCLHLNKEWAIENLVGFIEFAQLFRALLLQKSNDVELHLGLLSEYKFENVEELPKSDIIFNHDKYEKVSHKTIALYHKYIVSGSDFQLNLSAQVRNKWIEAIKPLRYIHVSKSNTRRISSIQQFGRRISSIGTSATNKLSTIVQLEPPKMLNTTDSNSCSVIQVTDKVDTSKLVDGAINFVRSVTNRKKKK